MKKNTVPFTTDRVIITQASIVELANAKRQVAQEKRDFDRAAGKRNLAMYEEIEAHRINDELDASYAAMDAELEALARARFGGSSTLWEYEEAYALNDKTSN